MINREPFFRLAWKGALGICFEILLVAFFIIAGFAVCLFWWSVFK